MKSRFNRAIAIVLSCTLVFSLVAVGTAGTVDYVKSAGASTPVAAAQGSSYAEVNTVEEAAKLIEANPEVYGEPVAEAEKIPTIIIPGISQSISYLANEDGTPYINKDGDELSGGLLIIDQSTLYQTLLSNLLVPLCQTLIYQKDMGFTDAVYDTVCDVFSIQESGLDGKPVNNLQTVTYNYSVGEMSQEDRDYFYRMIPMQSVTDVIGEDNLYCFAFPLIGQPMESAQKLDEYIQMVKEQRDCEKVNLITISLGGTILTAYLDLDNVDGSDLNQVINVVSLLQGTDLLTDFYARNFILDDEFVYSEYIPMIMKESNGYGTLGYLINIMLRILPRDVFEKTLTRAVDGILDTLMLNCPQFWSMISNDRYEGLAERYLADADHAQLRAITDRFYEAQCNLKQNLVNIKTNKGVGINNICGYDLTYSDYDYCFFGIMKSTRTTNSDGIIDIDSTSLGATYAPSNTILPLTYTPAVGGYISPDGSVDASTCLFPDNVWFFYDQHHEVGRNDAVIKLCGKLISGEIRSTADLSDKFPQFNGSRNTKNLTRWYIPECEEVLANSQNYNAADVAEVQAAYDEAKLMLADTVCNSAQTEACTERVYNALCRVGVRQPKEDQSTNEALEAICKFMNDVLFTVYGPQGFSDWKDNGVAITK